jgi:methylenetetrahydrofolate--tRNA-(uracil-5-)-methyltransferase
MAHSAAGILKREMRALGSVVIDAAYKTRVAAGNALAVDRNAFSATVTAAVQAHPRIELVHEEVLSIPPSGTVIVATGPLTDGALAEDIQRWVGTPLSFYDAAAPIVTFESVDMAHAFFGGRYDQSADYLNCPLERERYEAFYQTLMDAERAPQQDFDLQYYQGCMPIEALASRGFQTPLFGPMSPKGMTDPNTGRRPFALVQLRREDAAGTMWNIVGFQTNLKFGEQRRVFGLIPALERATYVRYGVMHRNTFLPSGTLDKTFSLKTAPRIRFAGQITGVEGYVESAATGLLAGLYAGRALMGQSAPQLDNKTALGALANYVGAYEGGDYQPMGINFAIMASPTPPIKNKKERHRLMSEAAQTQLRTALRACGMEEASTWK